MRTLDLIVTAAYENDRDDSTSIHLKIDADDDACPECLKERVAEMIVRRCDARIENNEKVFHFENT